MSHIKAIHAHNKGVLFWGKFRQKHPKYKVHSRMELVTIMNEMLDFFAENIATSKHGIVLNGLGYFGNAVFRRRKILKGVHKEYGIVNNFGGTDNIYECTFYPDIFIHNPLHNWLFTPASSIKLGMKKAIDGGMRYKYHGDILRRNKKAIKYYLQDDNV
jgi:hypothetical protein